MLDSLIQMPSEPSPPWYGLTTRPKHEKMCGQILQGKGLESYLPVYRTRRRWSDRIVESERPLFPGYLFCRFEPHKRVPVLNTPGVLSVVGVGSQPEPIPEHEIEAIQQVLRSGLTVDVCLFLREGQRIRV